MMDTDFHNTIFDVVSIGSATLDVTLKSEKFQLIEHDGKTVLCQVYDQKIDIDQVALSSGGAGTNTSVGFSRQGFKAACIAEVGHDIASEAILRELERENVDWRMIVRESDEDTGVSALLISSDGARTALVHRGASRMLDTTDIHWDGFKTKHLHLSSVGSEGMIERVMEYCRANNTSLSWSPGNWEIEQVASGAVTLEWPERSLLIMNREEFARFTSLDYMNDELWASDWRFAGPELVIVTDGSRGGVVQDNSSNKVFRFEAERVDVVQETGAGDAFASGFVSSWLRGKSLEEATDLGKKNAASVVSHMGAKTGLLRASREDVPISLDNSIQS